jgi:hypothetical protein
MVGQSLAERSIIVRLFRAGQRTVVQTLVLALSTRACESTIFSWCLVYLCVQVVLVLGGSLCARLRYIKVYVGMKASNLYRHPSLRCSAARCFLCNGSRNRRRRMGPETCEADKVKMPRWQSVEKRDFKVRLISKAAGKIRFCGSMPWSRRSV